MKTQLTHVFDKSTCLNKRQMNSYITKKMSEEECHAVEHHLNSCPLCDSAIDGLQSNPREAASILQKLSPAFIVDYFSAKHPEIHFNSFGPHSAQLAGKQKKQPIWVTTIITVSMALGLAAFMYFKAHNL